MRYAHLVFLVVACVCGMLLGSGVLYSQQTTGSIRGSITDPSGAAIPDATVVATNTGTSETRTARSSASGAYLLPLLHPGVYAVTVEAKGFEKAIRKDVHVAITETAAADFELQIGSSIQSVTVTGTIPVLQTQNSSQGYVIGHTSINSLPLATRNFTQLLGLTAGVVTAPVNAEGVGYGTVQPNVNGARGGSNNYLLDGVMNNNSMNNAIEGIGIPSPSFLQEFKVITNMYSAEYGRNSGGIVNVVTRSGTNVLHGSLYDYLRNTKLVARDFFAPQRGVNLQNQFGGTIGGPVIIPKLYNGKDRTFFFFGYEGLRERNTNSSAATLIGFVPTADERQGIFTQPIIDPTTGAAFPLNTIPSSRINNTSALLVQNFYPLPNANGAAFNYVQSFGTPFNANQFIYRIDHSFSPGDQISFRQFNNSSNEFTQSGRLPGFGDNNTFQNQQYELSETHTFKPTLLNVFRAGLYNYKNPSTWQPSVDALAAVGIDNPNPEGLPVMSISGFLAPGPGYHDYRDHVKSYVIGDTLSSIVGSHSINYGTEVRLSVENSWGIAYAGQFDFNGQYTGNAFADFLLGGPHDMNVGNGPGQVIMHDNNFDFFAQDDWKVSRRLTVNLGLRYEYNKPLTEMLLGKIINFYPQLYQGAGTNSGLVMGGVTPGVSTSTYYTSWHNFAPRVGFAYALGPQRRTVIRAGFGIYYDTASGQIVQQQLFQVPYSAAQSLTFSPQSPLNGWLFPPPIDLSHPTVTVPGGNLQIRPIQEHMPSPYSEQWNFDIERQLGKDASLEVAYVGTVGHQLFFTSNYNYPRGSNLVRPFDGFSQIMMQQDGLNSSYHSLQVTGKRSFGHAGTFMAAYTFSKTINESDESGRYYANATGDPANLFGSKGLASFDRPQRLVLSYNVPIPNPFGAGAHGLARLLNGWEGSGITTIESGTPFTVTNPLSNLDHDGDAGRPGHGSRADLVPGITQVNPGPTSSKLNDYLNPAAFSPAPSSRIGTLGRNTIRGPGVNLWDIGIAKNTHLSEKFNLKFMTEFFNAFNHPAFANPGSTLGTSGFGKITSTLSNARIIQFALELQY